MSAVVEFVQDVGDAIGDVVEAVGDAVENVAEVIVDTVEYVAENPEVLAIAIAAPYAIAAAGTALGASAATISMVTQPITAAAISASQGGDLEDIGKAALGSFIAQPVGQMAGAQASKVIGSSNAAQNALSSAVGGAVGSAAGAAATGADVGESALMGAAGSAGASLAKTGATSLGAEQGGRAAGYSADIGEALGRSAAGGDLASELIGAGVGALQKEGNIALNQLRQPTDTQVATRPAPPPMGAQIGEQLAGTGSIDISAPASISSRPEFATKTGETGDIVIKYTEPDGYVTYRRDVTATDSSGKQSGYTIVYDPQVDSFEYEFVFGDSSGDTATAADKVLPEVGGFLAKPVRAKPRQLHHLRLPHQQQNLKQKFVLVKEQQTLPLLQSQHLLPLLAVWLVKVAVVQQCQLLLKKAAWKRQSAAWKLAVEWQQKEKQPVQQKK